MKFWNWQVTKIYFKRFILMHFMILFQYLYENCSLLLMISYRPIIIKLVTLTVTVESIILVWESVMVEIKLELCWSFYSRLCRFYFHRWSFDIGTFTAEISLEDVESSFQWAIAFRNQPKCTASHTYQMQKRKYILNCQKHPSKRKFQSQVSSYHQEIKQKGKSLDQ